MFKVTRNARPSRLALAATASIAAFGMSAAAASADTGIASTSPFRLNSSTLEPGCWLASDLKSPVAAHIDVTQLATEAHVAVLSGANFSIDQVLVSGKKSGYAVYNKFDTGGSGPDQDVDPNQEATDLAAPGGDDVDGAGIIICTSDHPDSDQNEPYVSDGLAGEVAAINRPIIQPTIGALGVSAIGPIHTYKVGFGYSVQRKYDMTWHNLFGWGGDPEASPAFDSVTINTQVKAPGVSRYNDIDEFGEAFSGPQDNYGQPTEFDVSGSGNPHAYLHNSAGLLTFTTEGDLPISWSVKPSLAPEAYGKSVALTDDMLRAWNKSWQDYYVGKGPKPTMPLAPGTNSPEPATTVVVNLPETRPTTETQKPTTTTNNTTIVTAPATTAAPTTATTTKAAATKAEAKVRSARLMKTKSGRAVQVYVASGKSKAGIRIRLYSGDGRKLADVNKMVATNRNVRVAGLHIASAVKSVKATLIG